MKKSIILIISSIFVALLGNATNIPLDSIKAKMVSFYKEKTSYRNLSITIDSFSDFLIYDRKQGDIAEGKEGVFSFKLWIDHEISHVALIGKDSVEILDMWDPIEENIIKLSEFLERNQRYSKNDALFYIRDLITTHRYNQELLKRFKGIFK